MKIPRLLMPGVVLLLGACAVRPPPPSRVAPNVFAARLADKYDALGRHEYRAGHIGNARYFQAKSIDAANGQAVSPDRPDSRVLHLTDSQPVNDGYIRLTAALGNGGGKAQPEAMANAQVAYDCWLAENDLRHPARPLGCGRIFAENLKIVEEALSSERPSLIITPVIPLYTVPMAGNADDTVSAAKDTLDLVVQDYRRFRPVAVLVKETEPSQAEPGAAIISALIAGGVPAASLHVVDDHSPSRKGLSRRKASRSAVEEKPSIVIEFDNGSP